MMKLNIDKKGLDSAAKKELEGLTKQQKIVQSGIAGDPLREPVPNFISTKSDKIINGANNSWIVLTRDRPASRLSGYGGLGDTQAGAIDIVVGRMSASPKDDVYVDPDFKTDAARIYISQKTDIDKNFDLVGGRVGNPEARSGIGIKADSVRLMGREGIKLITGIDEKNALGGDIQVKTGIDLIANNDDSDIQPMVKGDNLVSSLETILDNLEQLSGIVSTFLSTQMDYNLTIATHYHYSPFFGIPTTPSDTLITKGIEVQIKQLMDCIVGLQKFKVNVVATRNNYLRQYSSKYINSKYNNLN